jgi:hypothetical protein
MSDQQQNPNPVADSPITPEKLNEIKADVIANAKRLAMLGTKTLRSDQDPQKSQDSTEWWENEVSFDDDFWSVSFWNYPNDKWQIQITKVVVQLDGSSLMISYSIRMEDDVQFPGFQIYRESVDDGYRPMKAEEFVLLDRVMRELLASPAIPTPSFESPQPKV